MAKYDHKHLILGDPLSGVKGTYEVHDGENFSTNNPYGMYDVNLSTQTSREQVGIGNIIIDDEDKWGIQVTPRWSTQHNLVIHFLSLQSATGAGGCSNGYIHDKAYIRVWFMDADELTGQGKDTTTVESVASIISADQGNGVDSSWMVYKADLTGTANKSGVNHVQWLAKGNKAHWWGGTNGATTSILRNNKTVSIWGGYGSHDHGWDIGSHNTGVTQAGNDGFWSEDYDTTNYQNLFDSTSDKVQHSGPKYRPQFNNLNIDDKSSAYGKRVGTIPGEFSSVGDGYESWLTNSTQEAFTVTGGHFIIAIQTRGDRWKSVSPTCQKSGRYGYHIIRIPKFWFVDNQRLPDRPISKVPIGVPGYCHYHSHKCTDTTAAGTPVEGSCVNPAGEDYLRPFLDSASPHVAAKVDDDNQQRRRGFLGLCQNFINQDLALTKLVDSWDPVIPESVGEGLTGSDYQKALWSYLYDQWNAIEMTDSLYKRKLYSVTDGDDGEFLEKARFDEYLSRGLLDEDGWINYNMDKLGIGSHERKWYHIQGRSGDGSQSQLFDPALKYMLNNVSHIGSTAVNGISLYETTSTGGGAAGVMWDNMNLAFEIQSSAEPVYTEDEFPNNIWRLPTIDGFDPLQLCDWDTVRANVNNIFYHWDSPGDVDDWESIPNIFTDIYDRSTEDFEVVANVSITTEDAEYSVGRYYNDEAMFEIVSAPAQVMLNYEIVERSDNPNDADTITRDIDSLFDDWGGMKARVVQWGDEESLKSDTELIDNFVSINREDFPYKDVFTDNDTDDGRFTHSYNAPGLYAIKALVFTYVNHPFDDQEKQMAVKWKFVSTTISIVQPTYMDQDFGQVGGYGFTTIPWDETSAVIGGMSEESGYIKSLKSLTRGAPFSTEEAPLLLKMRNALDNDELGTHIGKADINTVRAYITGGLDLRNLHGDPPKPDQQIEGIPVFIKKSDAIKYALLFAGLESVHEHSASVEGNIEKVYMAGKDHEQGSDDKQHALAGIYYSEGFIGDQSYTVQHNPNTYTSLLEMGIDSTESGEESSNVILDINFEDITNDSVLDVSGKGNMGVFLGDYTIQKREYDQKPQRDQRMRVGKQGKKDKVL